MSVKRARVRRRFFVKGSVARNRPTVSARADATDFQEYHVYRAYLPGNYAPIGSTNRTSFTDGVLSASTLLVAYRVTAVNATMETAPSSYAYVIGPGCVNVDTTTMPPGATTLSGVSRPRPRTAPLR